MLDVVALLEYPSLNGGERSLLSLADLIARGGVTLSALAPPEGPLADALVEKDIHHIPFSFQDDYGTRLPLEIVRKQLETVLRQHAPDVLHANSLSTSRIAGPVAESLGLKSIGHLRDMFRLSGTAIEDLNRHTRLLAVSRATLEYHRAFGLSPAKSEILYNGVDIVNFSPRSPSGFLHRELGIPPPGRLIGSIGQIAIRKGLEVALRAFHLCANQFPEIHLVLVGERFSGKQESIDFERNLRTEVRDSGLSGRIHFLGLRDDVQRILPELTLLLHTARQEPLGRVLLEAGACQIPIVASDVGGTREIFPLPSQALLVPAGDPAAVAKALSSALDDSQYAADLGREARIRIAAHFNSARAASALLAHYHHLLAP